MDDKNTSKHLGTNASARATRGGDKEVDKTRTVASRAENSFLSLTGKDRETRFRVDIRDNNLRGLSETCSGPGSTRREKDTALGKGVSPGFFTSVLTEFSSGTGARSKTATDAILSPRQRVRSSHYSLQSQDSYRSKVSSFTDTERSATAGGRPKQVPQISPFRARNANTLSGFLADISSPEKDSESLPIAQRIYLRAATDLHSKDKQQVQHAKLMLHRLKQAGFEPRPKAKSYPSATNSPSKGNPSIVVTQAKPTPEMSPISDRKGGTSRSNEEQLSSGSSDRMLLPIEVKDMKEGINNSFKSPFGKRLSGSISDPNLFERTSLPSSVVMDTIDSVSVNKRKDSVSYISKRSSVPANVTRRRKSSACSQLYPRSSRDFIATNSSQYHSSSPGTDSSTSEEPDFFAWSHLFASIPQEERRSSQIRRQHLTVSIPICVIGKENPVTFTSIDAIEQTMRRLYPDVLVKKRTGSDNGEKTGVSTLTEEPGETETKTVPKVQLLGPQSKETSSYLKKKESISVCIASMKDNRGDYDVQLKGVQLVGSFAEDEALNVLFAKPDAIRCILEAMKTFSDKEQLMINACSSLFKMASASESNCVHILQNDGIAVISKTLRKHHEKQEIVNLLLSTVAFISTAVNLAPMLVDGGLHSEILSVMCRHASNRDIVRESCFIIGNLLVTVETAKQLMLIGGVHTIISMVDKFPDDEKILENACRTLGSFAIYDETCLDVALAGATKTVLKVMTSLHTNVSALECGFWALASLTATDPTCEELVQLGGVNVILGFLDDHALEENIQEYGLRVLCNLSACDTTLQSVCLPQLVTILQKVLSNFPESVELLEIALITLGQVVTGEELKHQQIATISCIEAVVNTMMSLPDNNPIQEHGCKVIGNVAVHEDMRKLAETGGASKAVISAMLTLDTCADIQEVGCHALMNLTADNKDNKVRIKNAGAVPTLLNTLREFDHDPNIVHCALRTLGNLVDLEEVCHLLLDENGLDTIVSLVESHESNSDILIFIAVVLCGVTELPDLKEEEISLIDKTLMAIFSSIPNAPDISLYVCQAIENLVRTDVGRETFMKENRMGVILSAMNTFTDYSSIHRCCCKVIAVVALYLDSKRRLITETTLKHILKSMELFPLDVELQIIGCGTISCIIQKIAILKHELIGQGGIAQIHHHVIAHSNEPRLAVVALMALGHVVPIDQRTYPKEAEVAFSTIIHCMQTFPENKEIQTSGCLALGHCEVTAEEKIQELIKNVSFAVRRHADDKEVQTAAAYALKPFCGKDKHSPVLDELLDSPTLKRHNVFWKNVKDL